ncbi:MAG TPA: lipoate--protein ligase family protein [Thermoplasmatales archaeon]|nr:lipoate--protein ligase family protein [Thermoplasmatales archaeon]
MKVKNGILKGELKVRGGKLIKCMIEVEEDAIKKIKFSGDFFMHPEEKIEELEKRLRKIELNEEKIKEIFDEFFTEVEVIGAGKEDFLKLVMKCLNKQ